MRSAVVAAVVFVTLLCPCAGLNTTGKASTTVQPTVKLGEKCVSNAECVAGSQCSKGTCECLSSTRAMHDRSSCLTYSSTKFTTSRCNGTADCSTVKGAERCVMGNASNGYVCVCDIGNALALSKKFCIIKLESDFPFWNPWQLSVDAWLIVGATGVAIGIVLTVCCVSLIMSGKCSGDPMSASAGRPRGIQGFKQLPFVPKRMFRQQGAIKGPPSRVPSRAQSIASIKNRQASAASLGRSASRQSAGPGSRKSSNILRRQSNGVDRAGSVSMSMSSMSHADTSEASMLSSSGVSMSEHSVSRI